MNVKKFLNLILFVLIGFLSTTSAIAQTDRKILVEHFTNTRCGICASRNPGLFENLSSYKEVMHLSIHPSRPYSTCVLNKHNTSENDARTNYYGIYGSTPRVVVQGEVQSVGVDFRSDALFANAANQKTPVKLSLRTLKKGNDSLVVEVVVTTTQINSLSDLQLFIVAAEDTVFYNAPNGEKEHYNVFRKVMFDQPITLPSSVGDSSVYRVSTFNHVDWDASRMYALAMVQNQQDKKIEQVESSKNDSAAVTVSINDVRDNNIKIYPNPVEGHLTITGSTDDWSVVKITDIKGTILLTKRFNNQTTVNTQSFPKGIYVVQIQNGSSTHVERIIKQ